MAVVIPMPGDQQLGAEMSVSTPSSSLSHNDNMKMAVLVWLSLQAALHSLLVRYSRARGVPEMFHSSVAVFCTEVMKALLCLAMVVYESKGISGAYETIKTQVVQEPRDTMRVCVPAVLYTVLNNLLYIAASHLDAATFMVTNQLKIFSTALFSIAMLKTRLNRCQWLSLAVLFTGICLVQVHPHQRAAAKMHLSPSIQESSQLEQNWAIGFTAACVGSVISGLSGVYFEKILKGSSPVSIWTRNVQMSLFSIPASLIAALLQDGHEISTTGFLYGFDAVVWTTVFFYCVGGLSVAMTIKYADNISKNLATASAIILSSVGSIYLFGFEPTIYFVCGAILVITSIFIYSSGSAKKEGLLS